MSEAGDRRTNSKHYSKLPGYCPTTKGNVRKAKDALEIPRNVKLPRCLGKAVGKVKAFEASGDFTHSGKDHICEECRCSFRAGFGTHHLGIGFCIVHDNSKEYKAKAVSVAENHKIAIQQGYPDKAYQYAVANAEGYITEIRKAAEESGGMTDLREDIIVVRDEIQKILDSYRGGDFKVRVKKVTGAGADRMEEFEHVDADDLEKTKALTQLMRVLGKLSVDNLKLTEDDVVTYDQVKMFAAGTVNLIERMSPDNDFRDEFVREFAKILNNVRTGRK